MGALFPKNKENDVYLHMQAGWDAGVPRTEPGPALSHCMLMQFLLPGAWLLPRACTVGNAGGRHTEGPDLGRKGAAVVPDCCPEPRLWGVLGASTQKGRR